VVVDEQRVVDAVELAALPTGESMIRG